MERMMNTKWLSCSISPGQFPTEFAIVGTDHDGKGFSLFAPREFTVPSKDSEGIGLVRVDVIDQKGDLILVRLPGQTFENGQYVTVKASDLHDTQVIQRIGA
jgi:hypothetical protein